MGTYVGVGMRERKRDYLIERDGDRHTMTKAAAAAATTTNDEDDEEDDEECRQEWRRSWLGEKGGSTIFGVYITRDGGRSERVDACKRVSGCGDSRGPPSVQPTRYSV